MPAPIEIAPVGYQMIAASQTGQVLGGLGAKGDYVSHLLVIPATTSPGNLLLLDKGTSMTLFTGGASSVPSLIPFTIPISATSQNGPWSITTGANVAVMAFGRFG